MEQEFILLIQTHEPLILKVCNVYCREHENREDLYQDIIIQLWKSFPTFDQRSKITTWLYRIALNTAVSRFRKMKKRPEMQSLSEQIAQMPHTNDQAKEESIRQLYTAIEGLSKVDKAITLL